MNIQEFARAIGVSTATVSRAIHGSGRISPATRQMVLARMAEMGFTPNSHAQRLVTGRSRRVALDFAGESGVLADMFFVALAQALQEALQAADYGLLLNLAGGDAPHAHLRQWLRSREADGAIIVAGAEPPRALICELESAGMPSVVIGQQPVEPSPLLGSVAVGLERGAVEAVELLVQHGHRRIGFIGTDECDIVLRTFCTALHARGIALSTQHLCITGRRPEDGARAMVRLLDVPPAPTAVFARTDMLAIGALQAAAARGLVVPRDLSLIGHDDLPASAWMAPPLTTVRVDCRTLGAEAARILLTLLDRPEGPCDPVTVPTHLVRRATVAAPNTSTV